MKKSRLQQMIEVAKLYYEKNYSQKDISKLLDISRATVSRLLDDAVTNNIVTIKVNDYNSEQEELELKLKDKFQLKEVKVAHVVNESYETILTALGKRAAEHLGETIVENDIIGISWGTTLYHIANHLTRDEFKNVKVVQLKGGVSQSLRKTYSFETVLGFSNAFQTEPILLNLPVIFENKHILELVKNETHTKEVIDLGRRANVAIYTVGTVRDEALLFQLNYLTAKEIDYLKEYAVGDICSRFFNEDGKVANEDINSRTIGIHLDELKQKDRSIMVAGGAHKFEAIHAAIKSKLCNEIVIDTITAKSLLEA